MSLAVSVVVPVHDGEATLADCLRALAGQSLDRSRYDVIVVDDGSTDSSAAIAERFGARLLSQDNRGPGAARNTGWREARAPWVAFTDADCIPSRGWLARLLSAVERPGRDEPALGAAGRTVGSPSTSAVARLPDLIGSLDAERHLAHPRFPFAPSGNVLYRRDALAAADGFDPRYRSYEACDLHTRLRRLDRGPFVFEPRALVLHRHRTTWRRYWRQQLSYGQGYAQFMWHHAGDVGWSPRDELRAWGQVARLGLTACRPGRGDESLVRRGRFVKELAQRSGFASTYWDPRERSRW